MRRKASDPLLLAVNIHPLDARINSKRRFPHNNLTNKAYFEQLI